MTARSGWYFWTAPEDYVLYLSNACVYLLLKSSEGSQKEEQWQRSQPDETQQQAFPKYPAMGLNHRTGEGGIKTAKKITSLRFKGVFYIGAISSAFSSPQIRLFI